MSYPNTDLMFLPERQRIQYGMNTANALSVPLRVVEYGIEQGCHSTKITQKVCQVVGDALQTVVDAVIPESVSREVQEFKKDVIQIFQQKYDIPPEDTAYYLESLEILGLAGMSSGAGKAAATLTKIGKNSKMLVFLRKKTHDKKASSNPPHLKKIKHLVEEYLQSEIESSISSNLSINKKLNGFSEDIINLPKQGKEFHRLLDKKTDDLQLINFLRVVKAPNTLRDQNTTLHIDRKVPKSRVSMEQSIGDSPLSLGGSVDLQGRAPHVSLGYQDEGGWGVGVTLTPNNIKNTSVSVSGSLPQIGQAGISVSRKTVGVQGELKGYRGSVNVDLSKPKNSQVSGSGIVRIYGVPVRVGAVVTIGRPEEIKLQASLPLDKANVVTRYVGIKIPEVPLVSLRVKSVVKKPASTCNKTIKVVKKCFGRKKKKRIVEVRQSVENEPKNPIIESLIEKEITLATRKAQIQEEKDHAINQLVQVENCENLPDSKPIKNATKVLKEMTIELAASLENRDEVFDSLHEALNKWIIQKRLQTK